MMMTMKAQVAWTLDSDTDMRELCVAIRMDNVTSIVFGPGVEENVAEVYMCDRTYLKVTNQLDVHRLWKFVQAMNDISDGSYGLKDGFDSNKAVKEG